MRYATLLISYAAAALVNTQRVKIMLSKQRRYDFVNSGTRPCRYLQIFLRHIDAHCGASPTQLLNAVVRLLIYV